MTRLSTSRAAEPDRTRVRDLMRAVHYEWAFRDIPFSTQKFDSFFDKTLSDPDQHFGLKVELGDRVLGSCYAVLGGCFIGDGTRIVTVNEICVQPDVRSTAPGTER